MFLRDSKVEIVGPTRMPYSTGILGSKLPQNHSKTLYILIEKTEAREQWNDADEGPNWS